MARGKPRTAGVVYVGVDVSKDKLAVSWKGLDDAIHDFEIANNEVGWRELLGRATEGRRVGVARVVVEATGPYSAGIVAETARHPSAQVMRLRPADAKRFGRLVARAKTDRVDARVLRQYAEVMPFRATALPSEETRKIRKMSRHLSKLVARRAASVVEQKAATIEGIDAPILWAFEAEQKALDGIITKLEEQILDALRSHARAAGCVDNWMEIKGVKVGVVTRVLPELLAFPAGLTPKQVAAMAGLDPRPKQSGQQGTRGSWKISKQGHSRIRQILWCAANTAVRFEPAIKAYYEALLARGKEKMVALVAVMRKLLVALWMMFKTGERFSPKAFTVRFSPGST